MSDVSLCVRWRVAPLGEILAIVRGVSYTKNDASRKPGDGFVPILRATNINQSLDFDDLVYVPCRCVSAEQMLCKDDIVIAASSGSLGVVGKAARLVEGWSGSFGAFCMCLRVYQGTNAKYVSYFLQTSEYRRHVSTVAAGSNINNLRRAHIQLFPIRLAPLNEQRRIVAKIEELFSDLDAGVAALERVRAKLKRYRASVLNAATTGKLTEGWRRENHRVESGQKLLARILLERRNKWLKSQSQKYSSTGRLALKGWQEKYPQPVKIHETDLPQLPKSWMWAALDAICEIAGGVTKGQKHSPETVLRNVPYLRVANVQRGRLDLTEMKTIAVTEEDIRALRLHKGDILFNEGGDRDKLGRGWIWNDEIDECIHQNHVFRARPFLPEIASKFISFYGNSFGQLWFQRAGKQSVNLASINMGVLRRFPVPVPPALEQDEIVAEVDRRLSVVDAAEVVIEHGLKRASRLRQAILKRAFEGKLVPQIAGEATDAMSAPIERIATTRRGRIKRRPMLVRKKHRKGIAFDRGAVMSRIVHRIGHSKSFGRTEAMKTLYLAEAWLGVDLELEPVREEFGPLDEAIYRTERLAQKRGWFFTNRSGPMIRYSVGPAINDRLRAAERIIDNKCMEFDRLLDEIAKMETEQAELFATTFASWNDLLIDGKQADDDSIVREVHRWHPGKFDKFPANRVKPWIAWMRKKGFVPKGSSPRCTLPTPTSAKEQAAHE